MSRKNQKARKQAFDRGEKPPEASQEGATTARLTDDDIRDFVAALPEEIAPAACPFPGRPDMGDKDPLVMAWYRDNATEEEYVRRYNNRIVPQGEFITPRFGGVFQRGPVSDFEDEADEVKKPTVILP